MKNKHTQGEWRAIKFPEMPSHYLISAWTGEHPNIKALNICSIPYQHMNFEEIQANAKLIAAAPELLEALNGLNHLWSGKEDWPEVQRALDAIKKATK